MAEAQFLRHGVEEKRNAIKRTWAYNLRTEEALKAVALKGKLKIAEMTIESLKNIVNKCGQEARELLSKLLVSEAQLGSVDVRLRRAEMKAYKSGFEECKALARQILPSAKVSLLQIPVPVISHALAIFRIDRG